MYFFAALYFACIIMSSIIDDHSVIVPDNIRHKHAQCRVLGCLRSSDLYKIVYSDDVCEEVL